MSPSEFGERLYTLRRQILLSRYEMNRRLHKNSHYIQGIERGEYYPSLPVFFAICEILDVTPNEFFDTTLLCPSGLKSLRENAKELSPKEAQFIQDTLRFFMDQKPAFQSNRRSLQ